VGGRSLAVARGRGALAISGGGSALAVALVGGGLAVARGGHLAVALVGGRLAIRRRRRSLSVALPVALAVVLAGWLLTVALRGGLVRGLLGEARRVVRTLVLGGLRRRAARTLGALRLSPGRRPGTGRVLGARRLRSRGAVGVHRAVLAGAALRGLRLVCDRLIGGGILPGGVLALVGAGDGGSGGRRLRPLRGGRRCLLVGGGHVGRVVLGGGRCRRCRVLREPEVPAVRGRPPRGIRLPPRRWGPVGVNDRPVRRRIEAIGHQA